MKKRILAICMVMLMTITGLIGCGSDAGSEDTQGTTEKKFNMAISEMPEVLSPTDGTDSAMTYLQAMYERLYAEDADGNMHYYLAESYDVSADGMKYTVHLNPDAVWSDGTAITADDVVFTLSYYQTHAQSVVSTLQSGYSVAAVDEKTVEITMERPTGSFYSDLGSVRLMPSHVFEGNIDAVDGSEKLTGTGVVTSGPYVISEWNAGESMVLSAREDYYRGKANIETLNFIVMPEANSQELAFERGELSCLEISTVDVYDKFNTDDYNMTVFPAGKVVHLQYNPDGQEGNGLSDEERNAVALAIDREEIAAVAYGNDTLAMPANSCFATTQKYYNDEITHEQDVEGAKALVESTGLADKTMTIIYNNFAPGSENIAVVLQQQLTEAGMNVQVQGYDATAFYGRVFHTVMGITDAPEALDWDWAVGFDGGLYGDASAAMVSYAFMGLFGEEGSGMMLGASVTPDEAEREAIFKQAQVVVDQANTFISLVETNTVVATHKNVTGVDAVKSKPIFLDYWSLGIE